MYTHNYTHGVHTHMHTISHIQTWISAPVITLLVAMSRPFEQTRNIIKFAYKFSHCSTITYIVHVHSNNTLIICDLSDDESLGMLSLPTTSVHTIVSQILCQTGKTLIRAIDGSHWDTEPILWCMMYIKCLRKKNK